MTILTQQFEVPFPHPLLNMNERLHWSERAAGNAAWRDAAYWWAKQHKLRCRATGKVDVSIDLGVKDPAKRRDPHNFMPTIKAICDGFTHAAVWPDDDHSHVHTNEPTFTDAIQPGWVRVSLAWEETDE